MYPKLQTCSKVEQENKILNFELYLILLKYLLYVDIPTSYCCMLKIFKHTLILS